MTSSATILEQYDKSVDDYQVFVDRLSSLIKLICKKSEIRIHSISSRVKSRDSLLNKLLHNEGKYQGLSSLTDVAGVRVITYFDDDVDEIAKIIRQEFQIDQDNSIDKRALLDPDRFGYLSLHYVVAFGSSRSHLPEYGEFTELSAEVQIRSILQHTWAEIEHDLGYKAKGAVPAIVRRRFSRIASLLELADSEFRRTRDQLVEYSNQLPISIARNPENVLIDRDSVAQLMLGDSLVREIDQEIALRIHVGLQQDDSRAEFLARGAKYLGLDVISDIQSHLLQQRDLIIIFAELNIEAKRERFEMEGGKLRSGTSLLHLYQLLAFHQGGAESLSLYYEALGFHTPFPEEDLVVVTSKLIARAIEQTENAHAN